MSSGPTETNPTATATNTVINDAIQAAEAAAVTAEEAALDAAEPIFALPVIKQVTDEILTLGTDYIGNKISVAVQTAGTFIIIDTQVGGEVTGISQALANLMIAEKSGNAAQIQAAIAAYAAAQSALTNDDGSATPQ